MLNPLGPAQAQGLPAEGAERSGSAPKVHPWICDGCGEPVDLERVDLDKRFPMCPACGNWPMTRPPEYPYLPFGPPGGPLAPSLETRE